VSRRRAELPSPRPIALAVAGALADMAPYPRLGALALQPMPQGGVIRFRIELSPFRGMLLDLQCGAYMPAFELASLLRRTADRIEALTHEPAPDPASPDQPTPKEAPQGQPPTPDPPSPTP